MYQSIPSLTIPWLTPRDSHILVAPGVGFRSPVFSGDLKSQKFDNFEKVPFLPGCHLNKLVVAFFICLYMLEVSGVT